MRLCWAQYASNRRTTPLTDASALWSKATPVCTSSIHRACRSQASTGKPVGSSYGLLGASSDIQGHRWHLLQCPAQSSLGMPPSALPAQAQAYCKALTGFHDPQFATGPLPQQAHWHRGRRQQCQSKNGEDPQTAGHPGSVLPHPQQPDRRDHQPGGVEVSPAQSHRALVEWMVTVVWVSV
ncbi:voltage-dependent L-type calcium channel subunit alpha-1D [Lates japonicus]|uniref:Voltage-dependent L-type calcium channel subunit alpha-1D n=1 Tax=Lates japonicus TaxID=270547 RepID=A0AAD3RLR0_LATJO|nr:voltage-dependent L-type calcium channel subunit alpha-1D [Lates japonicus]